MLLPRPARLLRQCPALLYRLTPSASVGQTRKYAATATARRVVPGSAEVEIDESYRHLLDDMRMQGSYKDRAGAGLRSEQSMRYRSEPGYTAAPELLGEDGEYATEWEPREERRSPAAVLGSKRIGLVVLPEQLVDGIQAEISASDPREIREAFLALNPSTSSPRSRSLSGGRARKASEQEQRQRSSAPSALAKAAAFLPGEYAAVRNVLREMRVRLGDQRLGAEGAMSQGEAGGSGIIEMSGSLGSGVWAMADVLGHLEGAQVRETEMALVDGEAQREQAGTEAEALGVQEAHIPAGLGGAGTSAGLAYSFVHPGRAGVELADRLFEGLPSSSLNISTSRKLPDPSGRSAQTAIAMSTFHLSTLPTRSSRLSHLRALLASSPEHIVLIDRSTPEGWAAIAEARAYILGLPLPPLDQAKGSKSKSKGKSPRSYADVLEQASEPEQEQKSQGHGYHVLAPCPHDGICPILASSSGDVCSFSQRLQRPAFLRRTKHAQRGEEDMGYTYVVFSKGERPRTATHAEAGGAEAGAVEGADGSSGNSSSRGAGNGRDESSPTRSQGKDRANGRIGGVGREELEKARAKMKGKSVLREVEGGEYEMVSMAELQGSLPLHLHQGMGKVGEESEDGEVPVAMVDHESLRREAYSWPRLVAPPIKRSGHVVMDVCSANGTIQRQTYAKSHSKQGYHDARKAAWGDLFPHTPKGKQVERERGIRKLAKSTMLEADWQNVRAEGELDMDMNLDMQGWPTAELVPEMFGNELRGEGVEGAEVITWKSVVMSRGPAADERAEVEGTRLTGNGDTRLSKASDSTASGTSMGGKRGFSTSARVGSVHPPEQPRNSIPGSTASTSKPYLGPRPKVTIADLYALKASRTPITCLTAYDYPTALLSQHGEIDMVLVGDSLAQVCLGHDTTTRVTLDEMIHHASAVTRGAKTPFVFADLPFGSFEASVEQGVRSVVRLIKEAGVDGVKIEGGREILPLVEKLASMGVAVMPHLGLQPQRATLLSGYKVQARAASSAIDLFSLCRDMKAAGAFALLLEAIPRKVAQYITDKVDIVTIGIGAGKGTAGQVLVISDVLGTYAGEGEWKAKFVRHFGRAREEGRESVRQYKEEVRGGGFPGEGEGYGMKREEWEGFVRAVEGGDGVEGVGGQKVGE